MELQQLLSKALVQAAEGVSALSLQMGKAGEEEGAPSGVSDANKNTKRQCNIGEQLSHPLRCWYAQRPITLL